MPPGRFNQWFNLTPDIGIPVIMAFNGSAPALDLAGLSDEAMIDRAVRTLDGAYPGWVLRAARFSSGFIEWHSNPTGEHPTCYSTSLFEAVFSMPLKKRRVRSVTGTFGWSEISALVDHRVYSDLVIDLP